MNKVCRIGVGAGVEGIEFRDEAVPTPGAGEVLVRMKAASLNFRDLMVLRGQYPVTVPEKIIPFSDGCGEVVAVGPGCDRWAVGDRVAATFMQSWQAGEMVPSDFDTSLGGAIDGVLAEYRVFPGDGLVALPAHLSYEEGATLPCAGVTAWNALFGHTPLLPGQWVLTLGTGGVSIFALQLAKQAGANVIITSSSDEKLEMARKLGADHVINYQTTPEWGAAVRDLTQGRGVDIVVENGGGGTLAQSIGSVRRGGQISLVGVLTSGMIDPLSIILRGLMVGSRNMFEQLNGALAAGKLRPVISQTFALDDIAQAYEQLAVAGHVGKIVVTI